MFLIKIINLVIFDEFTAAAIISFINSYYYFMNFVYNLKLLIIILINIYYLFLIKIINLFIFDEFIMEAIISFINSYYYFMGTLLTLFII